MTSEQNCTTALRDVLIVEDSEDSAAMLAALLEDYRYRVRIAHTGARALELARAELPGIVLLDLGLPDMDGFEVAVQMRRDMGHGFRIVAFTGFSSDDYRERARRCGIDDLVTKPFQLAKLAALVGLDVATQPKTSA